jgi:hypothetical protein
LWGIRSFSLQITLQMGRQGGLARFTGSVGNLNCYFDAGMELVRTKSRLNKKKWLRLPSMRRQRDAATIFGAASTVAAELWRPLPAAMRRLADGAAYGRLVGKCRALMAQDPRSEGPDLQLWDAEEMTGLNLSLDSLGPHRVVVSPEDGSLRLVGMDLLQAELDEVLDHVGNVKPEVCQVAHPFWRDGLCHEEEPKESVRLRVSGREHDSVSSSVRAKEHSKNVYRSRVWIYATEVADTQWCERDRKFKLADGHRGFVNGFVTDWEPCRDQNFQNLQNFQNESEFTESRFAVNAGCEGNFASASVIGGRDREQNFQNSQNTVGVLNSLGCDRFAAEYRIAGRDWRTDWMGEGTYVVFAAIEIAVKRGRHWVRLPWCCKMEVLLIENGVSIAIGRKIENCGAISEANGSNSREKSEGFREADGVSVGFGRRFQNDGFYGLGGLVGEDFIYFGSSGDVLGFRERVVISALPVVERDVGVRSRSFGEVGYLDADGRIVVVHGWPLVERDRKVWALEDLLPAGRLERILGAEFGAEFTEFTESHLGLNSGF